MTKQLDFSKPVQTRHGRPARILATNLKGNYPIVAAIDHSRNGNEEIVVSVTKDGLYYDDVTELCDFDLVNVPEMTRDEMPPMPDPALWHDPETGHWKRLTQPDRPTYEPYYTTEQLREYAKAAVLAEKEAILDEFSGRIQSDLEHGVKCLNEQAAKEFQKNYPELSGFWGWLSDRTPL